MATRRGLRAIALAGWKQCAAIAPGADAIACASRSSTPLFARGIVSVARARGDEGWWNRPSAERRSYILSNGHRSSFASSAARPRDFSSSAVVEGDKKSKDDDEEKKKKKTRREKDLLLREGVNENIFAALLGNVRSVAVNEALIERKLTHDHITDVEFLEILVEHGVSTNEEQIEISDALEKAGIILRLHGVVYLDAAEITKEVVRMLPRVPARVFGLTQEELAQLELDHDEMKNEYEKAVQSARFKTNGVVAVGFLAMVFQLGVLLRLTYYELSWDVMEPIAFFLGMLNSLLMYVYFIFNRKDFSLRDWTKSLEEKYKKKMGKSNEARYKMLSRRLRR